MAFAALRADRLGRMRKNEVRVVATASNAAETVREDLDVRDRGDQVEHVSVGLASFRGRETRRQPGARPQARDGSLAPEEIDERAISAARHVDMPDPDFLSARREPGSHSLSRALAKRRSKSRDRGPTFARASYRGSPVTSQRERRFGGLRETGQKEQFVLSARMATAAVSDPVPPGSNLSGAAGVAVVVRCWRLRR